MLHYADGNAHGWWWQWWQWTLHMDDGWWSNRQLGKLPFNWMHLIMATVSSWMMIMMTMMTTKKMMLMIGYGNLATWQLGKMPSSSMPGQLNGGGARRRFAAPVNIRLAAMILIFTHGYNCRPVPHVTSRSFKMFSAPYIYLRSWGLIFGFILCDCIECWWNEFFLLKREAPIWKIRI